MRYLCIVSGDENEIGVVQSVRCLHELMTASFRRYGGPKTPKQLHEPTDLHWSPGFATEQIKSQHGMSTILECNYISMLADMLPTITFT